MGYKKISGIYKIENTITKKVYVGQSVTINARFNNHKRRLNNQTHRNSYLQRAWNKYGGNCFTFEILELTTNLIEREQYWLDTLKAYNRCFGYNINNIATSSASHLPEVKAKISKTLKGHYMSSERKRKISEALKGRKLSEETKRKMSKARKGKPRKPHHINVRNIKYDYIICKGINIIHTNNLEKFCRENKVSQTFMKNRCFTNKKCKKKGWWAVAIPLKPRPSNLLPKIKLLTILQTRYNYA